MCVTISRTRISSYKDCSEKADSDIIGSNAVYDLKGLDGNIDNLSGCILMVYAC